MRFLRSRGKGKDGKIKGGHSAYALRALPHSYFTKSRHTLSVIFPRLLAQQVSFEIESTSTAGSITTETAEFTKDLVVHEAMRRIASKIKP